MPAAIFDLDGTLVDTYDAHFAAWRSMAQQIGHSLSEEQFRHQFGRKNDPILAELHEFAGKPLPDKEAIALLAEQKEELFCSELGDRDPCMPGVARFVSDLRGAGWGIGVGSSAPPGNIAFLLSRLQDAGVMFDAVACGDDVENGKPAPDVFLLAAERLGVPPASCVVVEDAAAGIEAARRAGMAVVGMCSRGRTREELAEADCVVERFDELNPEIFKRLIEAPCG